MTERGRSTREYRFDEAAAALLQHTHIGSFAVAETVVTRLRMVSSTETTVSILQRLNTAKPGRCPCCGFRAEWGEDRLKPQWERLAEIMESEPE